MDRIGLAGIPCTCCAVFFAGNVMVPKYGSGSVCVFGPFFHWLYFPKCKERKESWTCHTCILELSAPPVNPQRQGGRRRNILNVIQHTMRNMYDCITFQALASNNPCKYAFWIALEYTALACGTINVLLLGGSNNSLGGSRKDQQIPLEYGMVAMAVFCICYLGFLTDWWLGALKKEQKKVGYSDRGAYFGSWRKHFELQLSVGVCSISLLYLCVRVPQTVSCLVLSAIMTVTYGSVKKTISQLLGTKIFASSLPPLVPLVMYPVLVWNGGAGGGWLQDKEAYLVDDQEVSMVMQLVSWAIAVFCRLAASDLVFDCMDMDDDRQNHVATTAVRLGEKRTIQYASMMMMISAAISARLFAGHDFYTWSAGLAAIVMMLGGVHEYNHLYEGIVLGLICEIRV